MDCPYFPRCGGCDFRDKSYTEQLAYKEKFCRNLLARFNPAEFQSVIPSPQTDFYRHKMDYCAGVGPDGLLLGMRQKSRSEAVVDIEGCRVFFEDAGKILEIFRSWAGEYGLRGYELYKHRGEFRYVSLRHSKSSNKVLVVGVFALSLEEFGRRQNQFRELACRLEKLSGVASVYFGLNNELSDETFSEDLRLWSGEKYISETINGIEYLSSPTIFLQSNPLACAKLYQQIKLMAEGCGNGEILDMYCGSGGISLQLAEIFSKVTAVDNSERNISDARQNAKLNNINNIDFICEDAELFLTKAEHSRFSLLVLDPPRQGLSKKTLRIVLEAGVENILYVSCNPLNLREDLLSLCKTYRLEKAVCVDMFPHTRHMELVVSLKKL